MQTMINNRVASEDETRATRVSMFVSMTLMTSRTQSNHLTLMTLLSEMTVAKDGKIWPAATAMAGSASQTATHHIL
ncbi:hypothetical protein [Pseudomonas syringae]|jgi:hypothetical protein|uniref:hypothetical protein n=1 Tax=Pseudomonas syringae TaxID=317 RepID=UPI0034E88F5D